jgi:hypothetical protein
LSTLSNKFLFPLISTIVHTHIQHRPRHPAQFSFVCTKISFRLPCRCGYCFAKVNAGGVQTPIVYCTDRKNFLCSQSVFFAPRFGLLTAITLEKQKISLGRQEKPPNRGRKNIRAMAHKNDYHIQKQLDKPQTLVCKYYPARIRNVGEKEIADRQLVF